MIVLILILLVLLALFMEELYRYVFCRRRSRLFTRLFDTKGHEPEYYQVRDGAAQRLRETPCERLTLLNDRGERLAGYYYPCGSEGKKIAFIVHGYRSDHLDTGGMYYDYYKSRGIDFFCCDHTAAGESEGRFIGFDVLESADCLKWIDLLRDKFGPDVRIMLHGFSMGGATVLQMSGDCPESVRCIVADSAYSDAYASMHQQVLFFYNPLRLLNRLIAGYDWNDSDVTESLSRAKMPILFVHGREDKLVPFACGPRLFGMYQGKKDFLFPDKTRHVESMYTSRDAYCAKLDAFVDAYMN